jgi:hypothetical protein
MFYTFVLYTSAVAMCISFFDNMPRLKNNFDNEQSSLRTRRSSKTICASKLFSKRFMISILRIKIYFLQRCRFPRWLVNGIWTVEEVVNGGMVEWRVNQ